MPGATSVDETIYDWVAGHRSSGLTELWRVVTELGSAAVLIPLMLGVVVVLVAARRPWSAGFVALATAGGFLLQDVLKSVFERPRPPAGGWLAGAGGWSLPSGHALQAAAVYLAIAVVATAATPWRAVVWVGAAVVVVAVGWSRVYLGVHWTTDVLAGWLVGALWVAALAAALRSRFATEPVRVAG